MTQLHPYLFFAGDAEKALDFYCQALGAEVRDIIRFGQFSQEELCEVAMPGDWSQKVMHAQLHIDGQDIFLSDGTDPRRNFENTMISLSLPTPEAVRQAFEALSEGGTVLMPLGETFFSSLYGMLRDSFGLGWMVMVSGVTTAKSRIRKTIQIQAPPERVWEILTQDAPWRDWTSAFMPGSHFDGTMQQGEQVRFLGPDCQEGMVATVEVCEPAQRLRFRHTGVVSGGKETHEGPDYDQWIPATEEYRLTATEDGTFLAVEQDLPNDMLDHFANAWTNALGRIKALAEGA